MAEQERYCNTFLVALPRNAWEMFAGMERGQEIWREIRSCAEAD